MQDKSELLASAPVGKLTFTLAVPAVTAQIVNMLYNMVDKVFIGHIPVIGQEAFTGVGVCLPVIMIISAFAALVSFGGAPRMSMLMGKGDNEGARRVMGNCFSLTLIVSAVLTAVFSIWKEPILMLFAASENTLPYALPYMGTYVLGTVFVQVTLGMNAFITAQGFAKTGMLTVIIGAVCNIALDPLFIFVFDMGTRGAALATIISQAVSAVWVLFFVTGKKITLKLNFSSMKLSGKIVIPCVLLGLSPFVMQFTESVLGICFNKSLLRYGGDIAVGAMTILTSVMQFAMLPLQGLTQGSQPIVSYNFGAADTKRVKKAFKILLITCVIYSTSLWALAMLFPRAVASLFTDSKELIEYTIPALRIYMSASLIFGLQVACQQTFIAVGNAKTSLFLAVLRKLILLIPLIYILPQFTENKVTAVYAAEPVADVIAVLTTVTLFSIQFTKALRKLEKKDNVVECTNDKK